MPNKRQHLQEMLQKGPLCLVLFSKDVSLIREDDVLESEVFPGNLESQGETQWHTTVSLNEKNVKFKLYTGGKVMAISEATFSSLPNTKLKMPSKALYRPAKTSLNVIGQFTGSVRYNNACCRLHVYEITTVYFSEEEKISLSAVLLIVFGLADNFPTLPDDSQNLHCCLIF